MTPERILERAALRGYVLHGSTRDIAGALTPRLANDVTRAAGNRRAVYLTRLPREAMFSALTGGVDVGVRVCSVRAQVAPGGIIYEEMTFAVSKPAQIADRGYVYLLPGSVVDEEIEGLLMCHREVLPERRVSIDRADFPYPIRALPA